MLKYCFFDITLLLNTLKSLLNKELYALKLFFFILNKK